MPLGIGGVTPACDDHAHLGRVILSARHFVVGIEHHGERVGRPVDRQHAEPGIVIVSASLRQVVDRAVAHVLFVEGCHVVFPAATDGQRVRPVILLLHGVNRPRLGKSRVALLCRPAVQDDFLDDEGRAEAQRLQFCVAVAVDAASRAVHE